jgi:type II secretory pathway pseudopilin PulG
MAVLNNQKSRLLNLKSLPHLAKEEVKMKSLLRLLLKTHHQQNRFGSSQTEKGMTLIELLIGTVMAFLILTPMLAFVVDMLNTDRREQVKSNTEQDIQAAVDFIAQDLSQAIYIYDQDGIDAIKPSLKQPPSDPNGAPILVFWKRQLQKNALPVTPKTANDPAPKGCDPKAEVGTEKECNDTYVLSLVAYYQINDKNPIWCQPSGDKCPSRIVRYQIQDGLKDPLAADPFTNPYYITVKEGQEGSPAYNKSFDIKKPTEKVTQAGATLGDSQVLVNYIHHTTPNLPQLDQAECQEALGNPSITTGISPALVAEKILRIANPDNTNSFYACVDTSRNLARVTIRGNSLRRLQADADYDKNRSAFFPTASVQVQGLGAVGK